MSGHDVVYNTIFGGFSLSEAAMSRLINMGMHPDDLSRHDPRLVAVVRDMGNAANGDFSSLSIAHVTGNAYRIEEYDGAEEVIERPHYWPTLVPQGHNWVTFVS